MKKTLRSAVKQEFDRQLNNQQIDQLQQLQNQPVETTRRSNKKQILAVCFCCLLLITGLGGYHLGLPNKYQLTDTVVANITTEVITNHLSLKPLEIKDAAFSPISQYFTELNFQPAPSQLIPHDAKLLGGRYCSIQGVTAAQLRYDKNGNTMTLYQANGQSPAFTNIPDIDNHQSPIITVQQGLSVKLWKENGLILALVEPVSLE